ncbi:asr5109 [Nostoc sp. PCC 7120 = FACHB-418]|nr:asr5109 [Nostoc sp. PCC 7120 = FACHB-418]
MKQIIPNTVAISDSEMISTLRNIGVESSIGNNLSVNTTAANNAYEHSADYTKDRKSYFHQAISIFYPVSSIPKR